VVFLVHLKELVINLIKIEKYDIIMLIDKKYLDKFLKDGWKVYNGTKEPSAFYVGDDDNE